jgi:Uma2 family endonuclease
MTFEEASEEALRAPEPVNRLHSLVLRLSSQGQTKATILDLLEQARRQLRQAGREADEDAVMDVMDFLVGWCSPHMKLPPDQPGTLGSSVFPAQGDWTEAAYLALDTNRLVELSEGCLEVLPMPTIFHQLIVEFLYTLLKAFVTAHASGLVLFAPLPVRLGSGKYREPDIVYLRPERVRDLHGQPDGADLVMEVVREGSEDRQRDLETKPREYAAAGIAEYWIVDPQEQRITVLTLDGQTYREHGVFGPGTTATSVLLPGFTVAVEAVFAVGQGNP